MINEGLTPQSVLRRIKAGERLTLANAYSYRSDFENGDRVPHQILQSLSDRGLVELQSVMKPGSRWIASHGIETDSSTEKDENDTEADTETSTLENEGTNR
jgi:hypothetical protein